MVAESIHSIHRLEERERTPLASQQIPWAHPSNAAPPGVESVLQEPDIKSWRESGFALVRGLFEPELIEELREHGISNVPTPNSPEATQISDFGSHGDLNFPSQSKALNAVTLHPRLLKSISQLLGVEIHALRLSQSDLWPKYGNEGPGKGFLDNSDQRIHVDYPNHTLAHPPVWGRPEAVEMIVYLSDVSDCGGPTAVVPRLGPDDPAYRWPIVDSPGIADLDYVNDRQDAERHMAKKRPHLVSWRESLYEREIYTRFQPGDVLFYRHDTWHRGTPLKEGGFRLAHNITYRKAEAEWISTLQVGWAWLAYRKNKFLEKLIAEASLDQRAVLGFPQPGSSYWCMETIEAVEARYGVFGMDMTPYRAALLIP